MAFRSLWSAAAIESSDEEAAAIEVGALTEPVMASDTSPLSNEERERDDLESIQGIGAATADALFRMGVRRFSDMTEYSPESLAKSLFERTGLRVLPKRIEVEDWIGQARIRAGLKGQPPREGTDTNWHQHAGFSVFFDVRTTNEGGRVWRTRLYHAETGDEVSVPDVQAARWVEWILQRARVPAPARPLYDVGIEALEVGVSLLSPANSAAGLLAADIRFRLTGQDVLRLAHDRFPFRIEVYTFNTTTGATKRVAGETGVLEPNVVEYHSRQAFTMPEVGNHELHSVIVLLSPDGTMAHHQGPRFQVRP